MNERQIVVSLSTHELVYFELDEIGQLSEFSERREMPSPVNALALGPVPTGQLRSRFLAVTLNDQTVRMVSLDPHECLQPLSMQALPASSESLCIVETSYGGDEPGEAPALHLYVGLTNGVLLRTVLDAVTGDLSDTRTRYLGSKPVKLCSVRMTGSPAVLAISSRNWLSYYYQNRYHLTPVTHPLLQHASPFMSQHCADAFVVAVDNCLKIIAIEKPGEIFNKTTCQLKYTPRKFILEPISKNFFILESEYNALNSSSAQTMRQHVAEEMRATLIMDSDETNVDQYIQEILGRSNATPKGGVGCWASLLRVFDPINMRTQDIYEFPQNENAHCMTLGRFSTRVADFCLIVGTSTDLILNPRISKGGAFYSFVVQFFQDGNVRLHVLHRTVVDEVPGAVFAFQGKILAGVGNLLRIYELGKQKLLLKCENKRIPSLVTDIISIGRRVIVLDAQESFHFVKYKPYENQLVIFADDVSPRWMTKGCLLDYNTVAGADKFGNIFGIRLDSDVKDDIDEDPTGIKSLWDRGLLNGAPQKSELLFNIHLGATVNSLQKCALVPGAPEVLLYTTLSGSMGVLCPFSRKDDVDFMQHVELYLRQELPSIVGRDYLTYRSYYFPMKGVVDGDTCEQFNALDYAKKRKISQDMDRLPQEVCLLLLDF